ncbi:MAG: GNAT family N-acetyltransferase [Bacteroidetes bacterium]|nr:GNAT family N-acetyltransferase [Bacteroidota bacterium]
MAVEPNIILLSGEHDSDGFDCGEPSLNTFLRQYALQHMRKNMSRTWLLAEGIHILAYATLCVGEVRRDDTPVRNVRSLPRHAIPVLRLARLATDLQHRGRGFATRLLVDALQKAFLLSTSAGLHAVEVHALSESASKFYRSFGFCPLKDDRHHLYLPIATIVDAFDNPSA